MRLCPGLSRGEEVLGQVEGGDRLGETSAVEAGAPRPPGHFRQFDEERSSTSLRPRSRGAARLREHPESITRALERQQFGGAVHSLRVSKFSVELGNGKYVSAGPAWQAEQEMPPRPTSAIAPSQGIVVDRRSCMNLGHLLRLARRRGSTAKLAISQPRWPRPGTRRAAHMTAPVRYRSCAAWASTCLAGDDATSVRQAGRRAGTASRDLALDVLGVPNAGEPVRMSTFEVEPAVDHQRRTRSGSLGQRDHQQRLAGALGEGAGELMRGHRADEDGQGRNDPLAARPCRRPRTWAVRRSGEFVLTMVMARSAGGRLSIDGRSGLGDLDRVRRPPPPRAGTARRCRGSFATSVMSKVAISAGRSCRLPRAAALWWTMSRRQPWTANPPVAKLPDRRLDRCR